MRDSTRMAGTIVIWIVFSIVASAMMTSATGPIAHVDGNALFGILAVMAATAALMTAVIWFGGTRAPTQDAWLARGKRKHTGRDRIERLIADLDDDDVYELEALLLARDEDQQRAKMR